MIRKALTIAVALGLAGTLAGCASDTRGPAAVGQSGGSSMPVRDGSQRPGLTADGVCEGAAISALPPGSEIAPGIGECDLVTIKGTKPTDVLIGESGKGQREVQVLYNEPTGREIYLFTDGKLTRIVRPGQG
jgi:hypothetical protein